MSLHLAEIALQVAPGRQALVLLDQAGWHTSNKLTIPANITLLPSPPKCPELNPQENIWQFMRDNWLSNRRVPRREPQGERVVGTGPRGRSSARVRS